MHQCRSAGRPNARRLSADFIDDGQTLSNNESGEKMGNVERQHIYGKRCLQVTLGLCPSDRDETGYRHIGGVKESCPRSS